MSRARSVNCLALVTLLVGCKGPTTGGQVQDEVSSPMCGNGIVEMGEDCDDANFDNADSCLRTCKAARCGDGFVQRGLDEECDDGNDNDEDDCASCKLSVCGDGKVNEGAGEECDDGNFRNTDACLSTCVWATCGDGYVQEGEEDCDDQNSDEEDGCLSSCALPSSCGDGIVDVGIELCDDGDLDAGDGCDEVCSSESVVQLVSAEVHSCALLADGAVRCWGISEYLTDTYGLLGNQSSLVVTTPASATNVALGAPATQLATGRFHTCALLETGKVRCWGDNQFGQLGYGDTENVGDDETPADAGDVLVENATQIVAGGDHTCAILTTGATRCWGRGNYGQLGYGDTENIGDDEAPTEDVDLGGVAIRLAAGYNHTCAILGDGTVRCWGLGSSSGALGYGNLDSVGDTETPNAYVTANGDAVIGAKAVDVCAGYSHTCAVTDNGAVRCWGEGYYGRLGYGNEDNIGDDEDPESAGEVDVGGDAAGGASVVRVTCGHYHTCALLSTGAVRCWGDGEFGALGHAGVDDIGDNEPPAVADDVSVGATVVQLTTSDGAFWPSNCALLATGAFRCWGHGNRYKLGYGDTEDIGDNEDPSSKPAVVLVP